MKRAYFILIFGAIIFLLSSEILTSTTAPQTSPKIQEAKFFYENYPVKNWQLSTTASGIQLSIPDVTIAGQTISRLQTNFQVIKHQSSNENCEYYYFEYSREPKTLTYTLPLAEARIINSQLACLYEPQQFISDAEKINSLGGSPLSPKAQSSLLTVLNQGGESILSLDDLCKNFQVPMRNLPQECINNPNSCNLNEYCPPTAQCTIEIISGPKETYGLGYFKNTQTIIEDNAGKPIRVNDIATRVDSFLSQCDKAQKNSAARMVCSGSGEVIQCTEEGGPAPGNPSSGGGVCTIDQINMGKVDLGGRCGCPAGTHLFGARCVENCEAGFENAGFEGQCMKCAPGEKLDITRGVCIKSNFGCNIGEQNFFTNTQNTPDSNTRPCGNANTHDKDGRGCSPPNNGFCKNGECVERTCESVYGSDFTACGGDGRYPNCCPKDKCADTSKGKLCCQNGYSKVKPSCSGYGNEICEPQSGAECLPGENFCEGKCWNWCCPSNTKCITTSGNWGGNDISDCGYAQCNPNTQIECSNGWKFKGGIKCCDKNYEKCGNNIEGSDYPTCVAKDVQREGHTRCVGTGKYDWWAKWCPTGTVCAVNPNGAPDCVKLF